MDCLEENYGVKFFKVIFSKVIFVGNEKSHRNFRYVILNFLEFVSEDFYISMKCFKQ